MIKIGPIISIMSSLKGYHSDLRSYTSQFLKLVYFYPCINKLLFDICVFSSSTTEWRWAVKAIMMSFRQSGEGSINNSSSPPPPPHKPHFFLMVWTNFGTPRVMKFVVKFHRNCVCSYREDIASVYLQTDGRTTWHPTSSPGLRSRWDNN